jgi:large repetitive protein
VTTQSFVVTGLTSGVTYNFKVQSRNSHGFSDYSDEVTLLCAFKPDAPLTVTTSISNSDVIVSWSNPVDNGSPITGYQVYVVQHNSAIYTLESTECDGSTTDVISNR